MKKYLMMLFILLSFIVLTFFMKRSDYFTLGCTTTLVQKKDNIYNNDIFSITLSINFYKNGQGVIHVYGEAEDVKIFKVNRSVIFDYKVLGGSTIELTIRSVIKSSLDEVSTELDAQYFPALNTGSVRIAAFSQLNDNVIVSISSGAYFICAKI